MKMILADKIMELRKKKGLSQEELAEILNVSRQSISKWESAQSMPTMDKIVQMSEVFGVSTDFLLKDHIETEELAPVDDRAFQEHIRKVSMEEANQYIQVCEMASIRNALATACCILSPVVLLLMAGLQESGTVGITENAAVAIGMLALFAWIVAGVSLFIITGTKTSPYEYMKQAMFETEFGVAGMVKERKEKYRDSYIRHNVMGTVFCILAAVPVILCGLLTENDLYAAGSVCLTLIFVASGVFHFVETSHIWECYQALLQEGEFCRDKKRNHKTKARLCSIYWLLVTAGYLAWSFITFEWHRTWIVWPVAGVLSGLLSEVVDLVLRKNRD